MLDFEASWLSGRPSPHSSGLLGVAAAWECLPCEFSAGELALPPAFLPLCCQRLSPRFSGEAHRPGESAAL